MNWISFLPESFLLNLHRKPFLRCLFPKHAARGRWVLETDWGRTYGWYLERDGEKIGEVDYIRWDSHSQFWHQYKIQWYFEQYEGLECRPNDWCSYSPKIIFRNRRFPDVTEDLGLLASDTPGLVTVRFVSVPVARFFEDEIGPNQFIVSH